MAITAFTFFVLAGKMLTVCQERPLPKNQGSDGSLAGWESPQLAGPPTKVTVACTGE